MHIRLMESAPSAKWIVVFLLAISWAAAAPGPEKAPEQARFVHVFVALCDNAHQGIVPVPAKIGNGDDCDDNLY